MGCRYPPPRTIPSLFQPLLFMPGIPAPLRVLMLMVVGCVAAWRSGGTAGGGACVAGRHHAADAHHLRQRRSAPSPLNLPPHPERGTRTSLCRVHVTVRSAPLTLSDRGPARKPLRGSNSFKLLDGCKRFWLWERSSSSRVQIFFGIRHPVFNLQPSHLFIENGLNCHVGQISPEWSDQSSLATEPDVYQRSPATAGRYPMGQSCSC